MFTFCSFILLSLSQELVGGGAGDHNYKGIAISLLVIIMILGAIVSAVIIITPGTFCTEKGVIFERL